jgi:peptidoglycan/LPS O-acetylase OafA/YrhL
MRFTAIKDVFESPSERVPGFLQRVESLRGVAALMVAVCHSHLVLMVNSHQDLWRLNFVDVRGLQALGTKTVLTLFNGGAAVSLFFVISGLVLGLSLDRQRDGFIRSSGSFILRRAFRIYPALIVSLLLVRAFLPVIYPAPEYDGASFMFQPLYRVPQAADFFSNLLFISNQMNPVIWTLKVEMEAALLFPILHLMTRGLSPNGNLALLACLMWWSTVGHDTSTEKWLFAFYLGLMLPAWGPWLVSTMKTSPVGIETWLGSILLAFCAARHLLYGTALVLITPFVEGLSGMMLLACVLYLPALKCWKVLDWEGVRTLGRVSYSFYLLHFIVHYVLGVGLFHLVSAQTLVSLPVLWHGLLAVVSVAVTIPLAMACYQWVEKVFVELGKHLAKCIAHSFRQPVQAGAME